MSVPFFKAEISCVNRHLDFWMKAGFRGLEQVKIVTPTVFLRQTYDLPRGFVNHNLRFQRVPLFLAGVAAFLFFLGRSTGLSVASIKTIS